MKLIVGLGNPGEKYLSTRHNVGFLAIDKLAHALDVTLSKEKFNGVFVKGKNFIIAKPLTFMNLSGDFVYAIANFFKISAKEILIIYDDMDHSVGKISIKTSGSAGGQKGMNDILKKFGTTNIARIKIGIGRDKNATNHVLGQIPKSKQPIYKKVIEHAALAAQYFITNDIDKVMNKFNIPGKSL